MQNADYRVLIDACVLANYGVCDLFLRLAENPRCFLPLWSETILDEVHRTHLTKLGWVQDVADSFQVAVREHFPEAIVRGYEPFLSVPTNDAKDRHVLAAAIKGRASLVLTFNLKHFPQSATDPLQIEVKHPQDYLLTLYSIDPRAVVERLVVMARKREMELPQLLDKLKVSLPAFSAKLLSVH